MDSLRELLKQMKPDEHRVIYQSPEGVKITATKTQKFSLDDFGVGLIIPGQKEFFPTHVRLLVDLYLKRISGKKEDIVQLSKTFEDIYAGKDPEKLTEINRLKFRLYLDEPLVNLYYAQLLMIEQDVNFSKEAKPGKSGRSIRVSKYSPPRTFLMGFIRWALSEEVEIDRLLTAAVRNFPPPTKHAKPVR